MPTADRVEPAPAPRHSPAKMRTIEAALDLFTLHGVAGTSLQMIADEIGVTKAAIYHQFKTKDEIVIAAAEANMARLEAVLDEAELSDAPLEHFLGGLIDLAIEQRFMVNLLQNDPVMVRLLNEHEHFRALMARMYERLADGRADGDERVPIAIIGAAIGGTVTSNLLDDDDHDAIRARLLDLARQLLGPV